MKASRICPFVYLFFGFACLLGTTARAELRIFTLDTNLSSLALGGTFLTIPLQQQGPGSLTGRYSGTIVADVTGSSITFVGGSAIAGIDNGSWQPAANGVAGSAPANYGGQVSTPPPFTTTAFAAFRNLVFDTKSGPLPITGGSFAAQSITFSFPSNATSALDYRYTGFMSGNGRRTLAGNATNDILTSATIVTQAGSYVLTLPANIRGTNTIVTANDIRYTFQGQLVATAPIPLQIISLQISGGQLHFTINTVSNQSYTIQGSTNLTDWSITNDVFTASNPVTTRTIAQPGGARRFFRVRKN
jgi:hypothetical protein